MGFRGGLISREVTFARAVRSASTVALPIPSDENMGPCEIKREVHGCLNMALERLRDSGSVVGLSYISRSDLTKMGRVCRFAERHCTSRRERVTSFTYFWCFVHSTRLVRRLVRHHFLKSATSV